jgi:hypothetical protein
LCVQWKDGSTSWEQIASLKESNPVEIADYAVTHSLDSEPAFAWWVPLTLKRRNRSREQTLPQENMLEKIRSV